VLGEQELADNAAAVKNMETGTQEKVPFHDLVNYLQTH